MTRNTIQHLRIDCNWKDAEDSILFINGFAQFDWIKNRDGGNVIRIQMEQGADQGF